MATNRHIIPIQTLHLFPVLDSLLTDLLTSLSEEEWNAPTIAKLWTVKDIASHLLDGNLRGLSASRDKFFGEKPGQINSYADLVSYLNQLNLNWTNATKRLSPQVLVTLLQITGKQYAEHLNTLAPFDDALFSVAWAGQERSDNWFHIAREYTEKFLHQQQIRDAVGRQGLLTKELFFPFIHTLMYGLPHTYRNVVADTGTTVTLNILTAIGGQWTIHKTETGWEFTGERISQPDATVNLAPYDAWKLFSKGMTARDAIASAEITGNRGLGEVALQMVSVMA